MYLELAIKGDLRAWADAIARSTDRGSLVAMRKTAFGMRNNLRGRIRAAGFKSKRLSQAVAAKITGTGDDLQGRIYSVARYPSGVLRRSPMDLVQLFSEGAHITAAGGRWLAIPTGEGPRKVGRGGSRPATPKEMVAMGWKTAVVPARHGGNMVIIATIAGAHYVTHVLVKQVTLRKRYDLQAGVALWTSKFHGILADSINAEAEKFPILKA